MPNPAAGVFKRLVYGIESTFGTPATPGGTSQYLRRVTSTLDLSKDTYESNEIRTDFQTADFRHGVRRVNGQISGELSCKTYQDFFSTLLKRDFTAVAASTGMSITVAGSGPTYTITRAAGSWLTDGYKVGMVGRLTAGSFNAANLNKNLILLTITATVLTVMPLNGVALVAEGPIASSTFTATGKNTFVPTTGHTDKSLTLEHFYADLTKSEYMAGCKPLRIALGLPPTGPATVAIDIVGQDAFAANAAYFTSPTALTTSTMLAAVNGILAIDGTKVATLTGLTINLSATYTGDPVVGSNTIPFLFPGRVMVDGQATAYFDSVTLRDAFWNETETTMVGAFTSSNAANADFLSFAMSRMKLGGSSKDDGDKGLVQTIPFRALLNNTSGAGSGQQHESTTFQMQDSLAA